MQKNKKMVVYTIITVLIVVLVGSTIGYLAYKQLNNSTDNNNNSNNNEQISNPLSESELKTLGESLYNMTTVKESASDTYILYRENDIVYENLTDAQKLSLAYAQIASGQKEYDVNCANSSCYYEKTSQSLLEDYFHQIFGLDKTVNYASIDILTDRLVRCNLETSEFVCRPLDSTDAATVHSYIAYDYAEQSGNDINVYVDFLVSDDNAVYSDAAQKNKVGIAGSSKDLLAKFEGKTGQYKLTFKKDANDNYYWYSSQIVK